jgi:membrane protein implicated in regulation of membrane protease activity
MGGVLFDASMRPVVQLQLGLLLPTGRVRSSVCGFFRWSFWRRNMKKLSVLGVALSVVMLGTPVLALGHPQEMKQEKEKAKLMDIKGTVKADGDKITFVNDSDQKSWNVVNPETLKDHVGHHVEVSAHVYADKGEIHVMKVKMLKQ